MARVSIVNLGKDVPPRERKGAATRILGDVSIEVADGEFLVLVGPSGCGKTTLLRCIAGLESATRGEIRLDGQRCNEQEPRERDIAMVFQSYALYPHLSVRENLAFGLRVRKTPDDEIARRIDEVARSLRITDYLARFPRELSGGQQQRIAMGRAVVRRPRVFLFDEPLSNLDASLRGEMRVELKRLHQRLAATMIYVTHDQVEAMTLADRICVLRAGAVEQLGAPRALYDAPANLFVARFLGTPEMNTVAGVIDNAVDSAPPTFRGGGLAVPLPLHGIPSNGAAAVTLGVRAEDLTLRREGEAGEAHGSARVDVVENLGPESLVHLDLDGTALVARTETARAPRPGDLARLFVPAARAHLFDEHGRRLVAQPATTTP